MSARALLLLATAALAALCTTLSLATTVVGFGATLCTTLLAAVCGRSADQFQNSWKPKASWIVFALRFHFFYKEGMLISAEVAVPFM
jgi:hypothetical protein